MNEMEFLDLIKQCTIFSSIDEKSLQQFLPYFQKISLTANEVLFHQGDVSDRVYILTEGQLATILTTATGEKKILGTVDPVETIGELGVLSGETRSLTVQALIPSKFITLPGSVFKELCHLFPAILFETVQPIVSRSLKTIKLIAGKKEGRCMIFFPINHNISLNEFKTKLQKNLIKEHHSAIITSKDFQQSEQSLQQWKHEHKNVFIFLESHDAPLPQIDLEKADGFYAIGNADEPIEIDAITEKKLTAIQHYGPQKLNLLLLHTKPKAFPTNTQDWLEKANFNFHYHVRTDRNEDYQRFLRIITGTATGLVLGGGGARGFTHIGVIKSLFENTISIDMMGGTSIGAVAAACFALHESYEEIAKNFTVIAEAAQRSLTFSHLTWPLISLFSGNPGTRALQTIFNDLRMENLWMPLFCISSNLSEQREEVHRTGLLWEKLRGSAAFPGVVPPFVINNQLHYDGGLLNNLPVDVMRRILGVEAKIIASKLSPDEIDKTHYDFPPILTFWQAFMRRIHFIHRREKFPLLFDSFLNAVLLGTSHKEKQNSLIADILINPNLSHIGMLKFSKRLERHLIELGYRAANKVLKSKN